MKRNLNMKSQWRTKKMIECFIVLRVCLSISDKEIKQDREGQRLILGVEPLRRQEGRNASCRSFLFNSIIPSKSEPAKILAVCSQTLNKKYRILVLNYFLRSEADEKQNCARQFKNLKAY